MNRILNLSLIASCQLHVVVPGVSYEEIRSQEIAWLSSLEINNSVARTNHPITLQRVCDQGILQMLTANFFEEIIANSTACMPTCKSVENRQVVEKPKTYTKALQE